MTRDGDDALDNLLYGTIVDGKFAMPVKGSDESDAAELIDELETETETDAGNALEVHIQSPSLLSKLDIDGNGQRVNRYRTESELRPDTNGSVFTVTDMNLNREVTVKVAMSDHGGDFDKAHKLMHEALIVSYFDHPGIPPIYDLEFSENNQIYCTMKQVNGVPLSLLIGKSTDSNVASEDPYIYKYDTISDIANIFIKVGETLSYVHAHNVVHRNIKPEKIIIGSHGEVSIIGWDTAVDLKNDDIETDILCGTPLYMSPEQARCHGSDYRSDIYSFGATLFHVLFKKAHVQRDDFDAFWKEKQSGTIDELTAQQRKLVPAPLLDICLKCMAKNPSDRYQHVDEVLEDLRSYQPGSMGDISNFGLLDFASYWMRKNGIAIVAVCLVVFILALSAVAIYRYQADSRGWTAPIYSEDFSARAVGEQSWDKAWELMPGPDALYVQDEKLVTRNGPSFTMYYKERLHGSVAIEYDGQMLPGSQPGDLSVVFSPDIYAAKKGQRQQVYYLQNGAYDNAGSAIQGPQGRLDFKPLKLEHGVNYRIRGEIDGRKLRLFVDGELICSYDLIFPIESGYIGIYAFYDDKRIDNIRIYKMEKPERGAELQIADALLDNAVYAAALERYERIVADPRALEHRQELQYKIGVCLYHLGERSQAYDKWQLVTDREYTNAINFYRWNALSEQGAFAELLKQMYYKHRSPDELVRKNIRHQWSLFMGELVRRGDVTLIREFINFRDVNFPEDRLFSGNVLEALIVIGESDRALEMFPEQEVIVVRALMEMGQYDKIIQDYPHMRSHVATALYLSGRYQEVLDQFSDLPEQVYDSLLALEQFAEIKERFAGDELYLRKLAAALGESTGTDQVNNSVQAIFDNALSEVLERYYAGQVGLDAVEEVVATADGRIKQGVSRCVPVYLLLDLLRHFEGEPEGLSQTLRTIKKERRQMLGMRLWYAVALMLGDIDKQEFLEQPRQELITGDYCLFAALREDIQGRSEAAVDLYEQYLALPRYKKYGNAALAVFISNRVKQLKH